jgi:flavorubredoxin
MDALISKAIFRDRYITLHRGYRMVFYRKEKLILHSPDMSSAFICYKCDELKTDQSFWHAMEDERYYLICLECGAKNG